MSDVAARPALALAIQSRAAVREALDRDDMPLARRLRRMADSACETLCRPDAAIYREWAQDGVPASLFVGGGS